MKDAPARILSVLLLMVVALMFWVLCDICTWLVVDSYALNAFPKAHPFLGRVAQFVWVVDSYGGRYLMIGLLVVVAWFAVRPRGIAAQN